MKKILVVDDEIKIVEVIKSYLEKMGYDISFAYDGKHAKELFDKNEFSMILLDLMLPDISGEELCIYFRQKSRVPIIMITAKVEESDMLKGLSIGADDFITKPFSLKALNARIEAVLRRSKESDMPLFNKGTWNNDDLVIDFSSREVQKSSNSVNLTPNEFNILVALVKYPNKVFTREELISKAFGDTFDGFDRTIDTHIKNLRQKIETDPKTPVYILTVHGIGYKFGGK